MSLLRRFAVCCLLCALVCIGRPLPAAPATSGAAAVAPHDGSHDFDFTLGTWHTHIKRLEHPLTGSASWYDVDGTVTIRPILKGRGDLEELDVDDPHGRLEGLTLRLYNPQAHQWNVLWASASDGTVGQPMIGEFKGGRGEFIDQEAYNGRTILVRQAFSDITPTTHHFEQAFSDDGGKTWEPNWVANLTKIGQ